MEERTTMVTDFLVGSKKKKIQRSEWRLSVCGVSRREAPGAAQRGVVATVREMLIQTSGGWRKQLRCDGTAATHVLCSIPSYRASRRSATFFPDLAPRASR